MVLASPRRPPIDPDDVNAPNSKNIQRIYLNEVSEARYIQRIVND